MATRLIPSLVAATIPARGGTNGVASPSSRWRAALAVCGLVGVSGIAYGQRPGFVFDPPGPVVLGDAVHIRIVGLPPSAEVTVRAESDTGTGRLARAEAIFVADAKGEIDLERTAPNAGSYSGVDGQGLFWSQMETSRPVPGLLEFERYQSLMEWTLLIEGKAVASTIHTRWVLRPGIYPFHVRDNGLVGTFYNPEREGTKPGVIVLGGEAGGLNEAARLAQLLASHGYATLALAYFGVEALPPNLELIPLEYFATAVDWMKKNASVSGDRMAVLGVSKGAEAAMLVASRSPDIHAVVAYLPSSVVWQSTGLGFPEISSWSVGGAPVPFVPYAEDPNALGSYRMTGLYLASLKDQKAVDCATLPVERIQGPVLMISAGHDAYWPSQKMGDACLARLNAAKRPYRDQHLKYAGAGHDISGPGYTVLKGTAVTGGSRSANAKARADSWPKMLAFLKSAIGAP
ncbi:MAG: acyl-CoA thioesterase/bile acid-CoA:amino acid N-acyltransferase family protein [Phycisphaerae bacterium]